LQHDKIWETIPPAPNSGGLDPPSPRDLRPCEGDVKARLVVDVINSIKLFVHLAACLTINSSDCCSQHNGKQQRRLSSRYTLRMSSTGLELLDWTAWTNKDWR